MKVIKQDITTITEGFIGHQVNCRGVMGAGVALAIKNKWPKAYEEYKRAFKNNTLILGNMILAQVTEDEDHPLFIMHLCGQFNFASRGLHTDYSKLSDALFAMKSFQLSYHQVYKKQLPMYLPYGIGCGLAGGDWKGRVEPIIESIMPDVILCKWGG